MRFVLAALVTAALAALAYLALRSPNESHREIVTLTTDDPRVAIVAITHFGNPIQAEGLGTALARFAIAADEDGIPCDSDDLEVRTSNGVIHYPQLNLCEAGWRITLTTAVQPPPPGLRPEPALRWMTARMTDTPFPTEALHYAVPETDGTLMTATCQPGTGRITAKFSGLFEGKARTVRIDFHAPSGVLRYDATVVEVQPAGAEEAMPFEIEQSAANAFWTDLSRGAAMPFRIAGEDALLLDATQGAAQIATFVRTCSAR